MAGVSAIPRFLSGVIETEPEDPAIARALYALTHQSNLGVSSGGPRSWKTLGRR